VGKHYIGRPTGSIDPVDRHYISRVGWPMASSPTVKSWPTGQKTPVGRLFTLSASQSDRVKRPSTGQQG